MRRLSVAIAAVIGAAWAQDAQHPTEHIDQAHRPLFEKPKEKSKDLGRVTADLARALPQNGLPRAKAIRRNFIDEFIFGRMERESIPYAAPCTDEEFARRVYLDATGRIPSVEQLLPFLESRDPQKREKLVDQVIGSDAFISRWTYYFEDLFRAGGRMGPGLNLFHYWIREWIRLDRPYSDVAADLLTAASKTSYSSPGALYFARDFVKAKDDPTDPDAHDMVNIPDTVDEFTITYGKVFLGINLACISCHDGKNHLEKVNLWLTGKKREDFFRQAGFYGKTRQIMNWEAGAQVTTEYTVDDEAEGYPTTAESIVRVPRRGGSASPRFILTGEEPRPGKHQRDELARMVTGNIQFARAFTNRIWAELMGFGIVEPVDEFDLARYDRKSPPPAPWTLQPSNPELLDAMARDFQKNNFSLRAFMKTVMKSSAYQLSSRFEGAWEDRYAPYYARKFARMLTAPELHDAIAVATDRTGPATGKTALVMDMPDPKKASNEVGSFLKTFGQSNRDDMPKKSSPSALQAMLLMQSGVVTDRILAKDNSRIEQLLRKHDDDRALIGGIYLATVSRRPTDSEMEVALKALKPDRRKGSENLQWALINTPEFFFNY